MKARTVKGVFFYDPKRSKVEKYLKGDFGCVPKAKWSIDIQSYKIRLVDGLGKQGR